MRNLALAFATIGIIGFVSAPAVFAAETCAKEIVEVQGKIDKATDAKKKDAAMAEVTKAKDAQAKNDEKGCRSHLEAAERALVK